MAWHFAQKVPAGSPARAPCNTPVWHVTQAIGSCFAWLNSIGWTAAAGGSAHIHAQATLSANATQPAPLTAERTSTAI